MSATQRAGVYVYQGQIEGQGVLRIMQCMARFSPIAGSHILGMLAGSTLLVRAVRDRVGSATNAAGKQTASE